jgi:hypothetical protein
LCSSGKTPALYLGESNAFSAQLLSKNAVLLLEILDHLVLVAIHPSGEGVHQELQREPIHGSRLARARA